MDVKIWHFLVMVAFSCLPVYILNQKYGSVSSSISHQDSSDSDHHGTDVVVDDHHETFNKVFDNEMTLDQFMQHVESLGQNGLSEEFASIKLMSPTATFKFATRDENRPKNRYFNVLPYDHSLVHLNPENSDNSHNTGYINANFVNGFQHSKEYIFTQGPLHNTVVDFWQMIWEYKVMIIMMTTKTVENHVNKCEKYWPLQTGKSLVIGKNNFLATNTKIENYEDFIVTSINLKNQVSQEIRKVVHFQFLSWPDYGVPDSAFSILSLLQKVREKEYELLKSQIAPSTYMPSIVIHCSAGIGRTGTIATLDYVIQKFLSDGKIDIRSTLERIRYQRMFSVQTPEQYMFIHKAFLQYVVKEGHVKKKNDAE